MDPGGQLSSISLVTWKTTDEEEHCLVINSKLESPGPGLSDR